MHQIPKLLLLKTIRIEKYHLRLSIQLNYTLAYIKNPLRFIAPFAVKQKSLRFTAPFAVKTLSYLSG